MRANQAGSSCADDPDELERRAVDAYAAGDFDGSIALWEQLYDGHMARNEAVAAARAAALIALNLLCDSGLLATVRVWAARARRDISDAAPGPVHALLAIVAAYERFLAGDPDAAAEPARRAVELGTRFAVDPARGLGRAALARLAIHDGDLDAGIALLDELATDLAAGSFDPLTTGNVYCELICAAQWVGRCDRAREWTELMERWRHGPALGAAHGRCRVHRAELLRVSGPLDQAEQEALAACAELRRWLRREFGWPLVELGNIRLRRGDLAGAEQAFREAHERAWSPQPGLALLRLAEGDVAAAAAMVRDEIAHPSDTPWKERPAFGELRMVPLLAAQAEIAVAADDADSARQAAAELALVLDRYPSESLRAEALLAEARAALLEETPAAAIPAARTATAIWVDLDAPYDAASARLVLGAAHAAMGNVDLARLEWQAARAAFAAIGADHMVTKAKALIDGPAIGSARNGHVAALVRDGDRWHLVHGGRSVTVPDLKGIRLLARLLAEPGREFPALDLAGAGLVEPGMPVLDDEAKASYRRRLAEVEEDLAEAERDHDEARRQLAARDRGYLLAELSGALGLAGRVRTTGSTSERARTSVTRSLRYALARITLVYPELGQHLGSAIRTGTCCSYTPDPVVPLTWEVTRRGR